MWADASPRGAARRAAPIAALRERIEILEEENRQLRELLAPKFPFPASWRLSRSQGILICALRAAAPGLLTKERLEVALYGFRVPPDSDTVGVLLNHARRKLRAAEAPVEIKTLWGHGYLMPPESVAAFDRIVTGGVAS